MFTLVTIHKNNSTRVQSAQQHVKNSFHVYQLKPRKRVTVMANFTKALCFGLNLHNCSTYHAIIWRVNSFAQKGLSAWQQRQEFSRDEAREVEKGVENSEVWPCDNSGDFKRKKDLKT